METFLEEVGLELDSAGRGALIGREQTTSEGGIASMKLRHRKCLQWEITGGGLGSGQGDFVLGGWDSRKSKWRMRMRLGLKLETLAGETGLYPVNTTEPWDRMRASGQKVETAKIVDGGAGNPGPFQKSIIFLSLALSCRFLYPLSFKDI